MTTAVERACSAAVVVLTLGLSAPPAPAHPGEGQTPYRYVVAPPGVASEGAAESGVSAQPIGTAGFAGTTDNQIQLTLPRGSFAPRPGEQGVRVQLDQLDPATLPALPAGLESEGNGYRVRLSYASSGAPLLALAAVATLSVSAPAAPTDVLELVAGRWRRLPYAPVAVEAGFSSVVQLRGPTTLLQVYKTGSASPASSGVTNADPSRPVVGSPRTVPDGRRAAVVPLALAALLLAAASLLIRRRARRAGRRARDA